MLMSLPTPTYPATASKHHDHLVSGWRLLLAIALMLVLGAGAGILTWGSSRPFPFLDHTVDFVVLVVAEVYAAVLGASCWPLEEWLVCVTG